MRQSQESGNTGNGHDHALSERARRAIRVLAISAVGLLLGTTAVLTVGSWLGSTGEVAAERRSPAVAVEIAPITRRNLRDVRVLTGTLHPRSRSLIATRMAGRVEGMFVNIGDVVENDQIIATLDDAELQQAVEQSRADVHVAQTTLAESRSLLAIAQRNYERIQRLSEENIASDAELDTARAEFETNEARVRVSEAQLARAEAQLRAAQVRLSYATIRAVWANASGVRVVGERFVDEGSTVAANGPIVSLLDIDTLVAVIYVPERDYFHLSVGQPVLVRSDVGSAAPAVEGTIVRLAPEFSESSRQARVEVSLPNPEHQLKPGMFIQAEVELGSADDARAVPSEALVRREEQQGVFLLDETSKTVQFVPVRIGITQEGFAQVLAPDIEGAVITLGQHLLDDGSEVRVAGATE